MIFKIIRKIFINDLIAGMFFICLSYLSFIFPLSFYGKISSLIVGASFYLGVLFIGNFITIKLGGFSLIDKIFKSSKEKESFIILSCFMGVFFAFNSTDSTHSAFFLYNYKIGRKTYHNQLEK